MQKGYFSSQKSQKMYNVGWLFPPLLWGIQDQYLEYQKVTVLKEDNKLSMGYSAVYLMFAVLILFLAAVLGNFMPTYLQIFLTLAWLGILVVVLLVEEPIPELQELLNQAENNNLSSANNTPEQMNALVQSENTSHNGRKRRRGSWSAGETEPKLMADTAPLKLELQLNYQLINYLN
eukprot:TRINITY_DN70883_c0_g1_i1.p4 TRINITY_DN70883_c0_g1~~TRINITY_DN70883_c0_g1_i1.p4  ORF type:complete len:177 (+),score=10.47 TRINITY_DN70883_c0_g1_i1:1230-1760(+)